MDGPNVDPNAGFVWRAQKFLILGVAAYITIAMGLLAVPPIQRTFLFIGIPGLSPATEIIRPPTYYNFSPSQYRELTINTPDDVKLGAWLFLSRSWWESLAASDDNTPPTDVEVSETLDQAPTVLYLHGAGINRGSRGLTKMYHRLLGGFLGTNVMIVDYRGFGDSEGIPTAEGVLTDARAAWDWLVQNGAKPENIIVVGESLGSCIAVELVSKLESESIRPRGLALIAPYASVSKLLETYSVLDGRIPIFWPIQKIPYAMELLLKIISVKYDSLAHLATIKSPLVIVHAEDDRTASIDHARRMWDEILDPYLPPWPFADPSFMALMSFTMKEIELLQEVTKKREMTAKEITTTQDFVYEEPLTGPTGIVKHFKGPDGRRAAWLELTKGGHGLFAQTNATVDFLSREFSLGEGAPPDPCNAL